LIKLRYKQSKYMKKIIILSFSLVFIFVSGQPVYSANNLSSRLKGRILLQVEGAGESWYVDPVQQERAYLGRPDDAFRIMREFGLGISEKDYTSFGENAPSLLSGRILLRVELNGEAYYVNPVDLKMYYLGRPADAFTVMRELGLGITNNDLDNIVIDTDYSNTISLDSDNDGLTDEQERQYGTDINNPDSDGDGYKDGVEVTYGYDPLTPPSGKTYTIVVADPPNGGVYQGEMKIIIANEDVIILESIPDAGNIIGIPALPKSAFGAGSGLTGASAIFERFIGPTYIITPVDYVLKQPAYVKLCYAPEMVEYSSSDPLDESKAKIWLGIGDSGIIQEPTEVDIIGNCVSGSITTFPKDGIGIIVPSSS